jgi:cell division protein FtsB
VKVSSTAAKPSTLAARFAQLIYQWRRRVATVIAIAIAAFLGYHVVFGANGLTVYQQKRQEDRALQKQILELQQENGHLSDHVQHLRTDPDTIEHEARMILRYAKPGEVIYELNEKSPSGSPAK